MHILIAVLIFLGATAGWLYDVYMTEKGLKAGIAKEGNTWLIGSTPSTKALVLRDLIFFVPLVLAPAIISSINVYASFLLGAPVAWGLKHYMGGRMWAKLFSLPPEQRGPWLLRSRTAWQKFLGV